jgi:hypothetical protein
MRILHLDQIEIFFPVRPFFLQRSWAVADLYPAQSVVSAHPRFLHVAQIFALGYGTCAQRFIVDRFEEAALAARFDSGSNQITHRQNNSEEGKIADQISYGSDEHLILRHGPSPPAAIAILAVPVSEEKLQSHGEALNNPRNLPHRRNHRFAY